MAIFMTLPGIEGEATTKGFESQMELWSLSHGITQSANPAQASGHSSAEAHLSPVSVTKSSDKASPILMEKCCDASHFEEITFTLTRTVNKVIQKYMTIVLKDALIADISFGASTEGQPTETLSFVYSQIEWTYGNIEKTGKGSGNTTGSWNLSSGDREV
jgi:type VI secretion system secreted protein Hcp